jgi:SAM-dependent methyltransferase
MPESLEQTIRRLEQERADADRRYNDALTALDRTLAPPPELPPAPPSYDEQQITPLNDAWNILPAAPQASGLTGRLTGFVWRVVAPYLERQHAFNSRLVDHINRNVAAHREAQRSAERLIAVLGAEFARQAELHSRLLVLLQQVTPYVDTKDRATGGRTLAVNAALSAVTEGADKRWESMDARTTALQMRLQELREAVGVAQHAALTVKREFERGAIRSEPAPPAAAEGARPAPTGDAFSTRLDAYKYVAFEDQFRGSQHEIRERLESYLPFFAGAPGEVVDIGCGRGEFLDLLIAQGVRARGIDINAEMVEVCRARSLAVEQADAVGFLDRIPDASLGGLFAAQVVEHLEPGYLLRFLDLAFHKLAPGGPMVLETLNPACWLAFFESYIRDITHVRPLHPETLRYLVIASGFADARLEYRSPVPEEERLEAVRRGDGGADDLAEAFNANVEKLNRRLFTYLDYAVVARR